MQIYYNLSQQENGQQQCLGMCLHQIRMTGTIKHFSLKENCSSEDCISVKMSNIYTSIIILLTMYFSVFRMCIKPGLLSVLRDVPFECSFSFSLGYQVLRNYCIKYFFQDNVGSHHDDVDFQSDVIVNLLTNGQSVSSSLKTGRVSNACSQMLGLMEYKS